MTWRIEIAPRNPKYWHGCIGCSKFARHVEGSASGIELLEPILRRFLKRVGWRHLLQQGPRLVGVPLAQARLREQEFHRRPIGLERHADLQRPGGGVESAAQPLDQPDVTPNARIVFVEARSLGELPVRPIGSAPYLRPRATRHRG